jgi:hypothetical protein
MKYNNFFKVIIAAITLAFVFALSTHSQNVVLKGTTFIQQKDSSSRGVATATQYTYKAKNDSVYIVYVSSRGKAFIIRTSKRTGKKYRQYLPEVTALISKNE